MGLQRQPAPAAVQEMEVDTLMRILVLNAGSSSQKSCLYRLEGADLPSDPPKPEWQIHVDWTGSRDKAVMRVSARGLETERSFPVESRAQVLSEMLDTLISGETAVLERLTDIDVVGHRVVHGGPDYSQPVPVTDEVRRAIAAFSDLAPAHNPAQLEGISAIDTMMGDVPQVAVFDTAFHRGMPPAASIYPIPYEWHEKGIRRYGFHGISHGYCSERAATVLGQPLASLRMITCHLGNGCSLAAIENGVSVDTSMGFTPLEGLMMGSRSGSIDPAIPIYLMRRHGLSAQQVDEMLNQRSGLKGVSGLSADMREILAAAANGHGRARLALDLYVHRLRFSIGGMVAVLGGLDALVFTAGVGENAPSVRERACVGFEYLGLSLDKTRNGLPCTDSDIAAHDSTVKVLVIHTQEDWAIARECWRYGHAISHSGKGADR